MRTRWAAFLLITGCSAEPAATALCDAPYVDVNGTCEIVVPDQQCDAGLMRRIGQGCIEVGVRSCADGFAATADGWACEVAPIASPLPGTTSCAEGFEADSDGWGCHAVLPPNDCLGATRASIGNSSCVNIGDCTASFPPSNATVVVEQGDSLNQALDDANGGDVIAVDSGEFTLSYARSIDVEVVGRCASEVTLRPSSVFGPGFVVQGSQLTLSGVTLDGFERALDVNEGGVVNAHDIAVINSTQYGIYVGGTDAELHLSSSLIRDVAQRGTVPNGGIDIDRGAIGTLTDVTIERAVMYGVHASRFQATLDAEALVVLNGVPTDDGGYGMGVVAELESNIALTRSAVIGNSETGVGASYGSQLTVTDSAVSDTLNSSFGWGRGVNTIDGGKILLSNSTFARNSEAGVGAQHADTELEVADCVIKDTLVDATGIYGVGVFAELGAEVTVSRTALIGNHENGLYARHANTSLTVSDSLAAFTEEVGGAYGRGATVEDGATLVATDTSFTDNNEAGVLVWSATADLTDVIISDTQAASQSDKGYGLTILEGGEATCLRCAITHSTDLGVLGDGADTVFQLTDSVVSDTQRNSSGKHGRGVSAQNEARGVLDNVTVSDNYDAGLVCLTGAKLEATDVTVIHTLPADNGHGFGLAAQKGKVTLESTAFVGNHELSVSAFKNGTKLTLEDCFVSGTTGSERLPDVGHGVSIADGAKATISGTEIVNHSSLGVLVAAGRATLDEVVIANNPIGIHAQDGTEIEEVTDVPDTLEESRLYVTDETVFLDNTTKVGSGSLPVPDLGE
jgi:hypothetical protein